MVTYKSYMICVNDEAKLPWETPEEARDYFIEMINTYASDTDRSHFSDNTLPIILDSERTTLELLNVTEHPDSGPGSMTPEPGFRKELVEYSKENYSLPKTSTLIGSNELLVNMTFLSQEDLDTFLEAGKDSGIKTMLEENHVYMTDVSECMGPELAK